MEYSDETCAVDRGSLELIASIEGRLLDSSFIQELYESIKVFEGDLKSARVALYTNNFDEIARLCLSMSISAVRVGGLGLLKLCFELQRVGRVHALSFGEEIVCELELEYLKLRDELERLL